MSTSRENKLVCHFAATLLFVFSFALAPAALFASDLSEWRGQMEPIIPKSYLCRHSSTPITVDGRLDEPAWQAAPWTDDFGDIQGTAKPKPRFRTRAKMLWDDQYLYLGAELQEPHVWATLTNHDSVIFRDPDFEVFMDPKGETQPYYEFEMNALNTTWDLLLDKPYLDGGQAHNEWEIPGAKTAVQVHGTLNDPRDMDRGWTVEIAFPWRALDDHARHAGPPRDGEQWRINFSRVEWQITITNGAYQKIPDTPEDNWVWSPQGVVNMHRPEMWGVLQFTKTPPGENVPVAGIPGKPARDLALEVYAAQRDFQAAHERWADNWVELGMKLPSLPPGVAAPVLEKTPTGFVCSVAFADGRRQRVWSVRQDRRLTLDTPRPAEPNAAATAPGSGF